MPLLLLALPFVLVLALLVFMPVIAAAAVPDGHGPPPARGWVATANVVAMALSVAFFMAVAAVTTVFVVDAFTYSLLGLLGGCVLGIVGVWLSRWEPTQGSLHYTPNRWLVLAITLVVTARVVYGFWRAWHSWRVSPDDASWLASAGLAGSLAAGAVVLGYYLAYWTGVRRRVKPANQPTDGHRDVFAEPHDGLSDRVANGYVAPLPTRRALTAAPMIAVSSLAWTSSSALPCSGLIVTISCR